MAKPFFKAVGGKRKLVSFLLDLLPKSFNDYYEPFVGGGALYWALEEEKRFKNAYLNDANIYLVSAWQALKASPYYLIYELHQAENLFNERDADRKAIYNLARDFIDVSDVNSVQSVNEKAIKFLVLNRTSFNGLWRLNKKGKFNVPLGKYKTYKFVDEDLFMECHKALLNTTIYAGDFEYHVKAAKAGDVCYFDPPYLPLNKTSNFTSYTKDGFTLDDHKRLANCFKETAAKGVKCLLSNSDTEVTRQLYKDFKIHTVEMPRSINSKGDKRDEVKEIVVVSI